MTPDDTKGPEHAKLMRFLFETPGMTLKNIHISWGRDAHLLTLEERCAVLNRAFEQAETGEVTASSFPRTTKPMVDVREFLKRF
jgi:hypothetical protein